MPIRTDPRQQARLQSAPVIPTLPPEPSLESLYTQEKTNGLTRVFQTYDRARKEWSARVGQHLGRIQDASVKLSSTRSGTAVQYPNRGWAKAGERGFESSAVLRPTSAIIGIDLLWALSPTGQIATITYANPGSNWDGLFGGQQTYFGPAQDVTVDLPSQESVLRAVRVVVFRDTLENFDFGSTEGVLRVTLVPKANPLRDDGANTRRTHVCYSPGTYRVPSSTSVDGVPSYTEIPTQWHQVHYFEPHWAETDIDDVTNADMAIDSVFAELV